MRLIIAEKPSLGRAIAAAIAGRHTRAQHHIECSTGDVVAWCAGHVLEMAPPEDYAPALKAWSLETLPIVPQRWLHRVSSPDLVAALRRLVAKATRVVHAGDPDREGQLLVDEVLQHLGWKGPTDRLLVTDLSPDAVRRKLDELVPNERFQPLYEAALARQRADWIHGLNLTRLYTLRAQSAGYRGVLSVGRVQTPLLGLIVRRDREIEAFVSKPFFGVEATLRTAAGAELLAEWEVGKALAVLTDAEGRLLSRSPADAVAQKVPGQAGAVTRHEQTPHVEAAPLPFSLAELQIHAGRKLGMSAAQVLTAAQRLYERQLLTYPRSDCRYLPEQHFGQARGVLAAVRDTAPSLAQACAAADLGRRGKAWNDAKVTAHHAIIPTTLRQDAATLSDAERSLYELVARRYVQQFLPAFDYLQTRAHINVCGETFIARGRQVVSLGWRAFEKATPGDDADGEESREAAPLPPLSEGQALACRSARVLEKRTKPPKPFNDSTLVQAMCNVAKYVADPKIAKILQDADGIGTPATRAAIIEILFERGYVERQKNQVRSTTIGRSLIDALPAVATTPDLTAVWERGTRRIEDRELSLDRFLAAVEAQIGELVARGKAQGALPMPAAGPQKATTGRRRSPARRSPGAPPKASRAAHRRSGRVQA
jgi:DNA topoisomerase-3